MGNTTLLLYIRAQSEQNVTNGLNGTEVKPLLQFAHERGSCDRDAVELFFLLVSERAPLLCKHLCRDIQGSD